MPLFTGSKWTATEINLSKNRPVCYKRDVCRNCFCYSASDHYGQFIQNDPFYQTINCHMTFEHKGHSYHIITRFSQSLKKCSVDVKSLKVANTCDKLGSYQKTAFQVHNNKRLIRIILIANSNYAIDIIQLYCFPVIELYLFLQTTLHIGD